MCVCIHVCVCVINCIMCSVFVYAHVCEMYSVHVCVFTVKVRQTKQSSLQCIMNP